MTKPHDEDANVELTTTGADGKKRVAECTTGELARLVERVERDGIEKTVDMDTGEIIAPEVLEGVIAQIKELPQGAMDALAEVVEEFKRGSSKWMKTKGREYAEFYWQNGYGAFSIGQSMVDDVRKYIASQDEHHRVVSFEEEFRAFLERYGVEFDERYVWD